MHIPPPNQEKFFSILCFSIPVHSFPNKLDFPSHGLRPHSQKYLTISHVPQFLTLSHKQYALYALNSREKIPQLHSTKHPPLSLKV